MKFLSALLLCCIALLMTPGLLWAQASTHPAAAAVQKSSAATPTASPAGIEPAKEASIRRMFEVMETPKMMEQVLAGMSNNMRPMLMNSLPAGEYREKLADLFFERFRAKLRVEQLVELAVPIYAKYFSTEEIDGLTRFYQTPLGKKTLSVLPQTMIEMQTESMKLGEKIGRDSMVEVLDEHAELKKALTEAAATPQK